MTQQYQHIETAGERIKRWLVNERRRRKAAAKCGDQIYFARGFPAIITAKELLAAMEPERHALLSPPYVKEER